MAQIDRGNQFMSLSALADGKCKASFQKGHKRLPGGQETLCSMDTHLFEVCLEVKEDLFTPSCGA